MEGCHLNNISIFLFLWLALATTSLVEGQGARVGFYATSCPRVESIVQSTVRSYFQADRTIAAPLLRLHFHDCFVQGCDGSLLIEGPNTERTAAPNSRLRGFEVINDAKTQLEQACPGVVSCADILALVARDAVALAGGPSWAVPTGRRDGRVSLASDTANLPNFRDPISVQTAKFRQKGLNVQDLVALVGGHTLGTSACSLFSYRLNNFNSTNNVDPSINPTFLPTLGSLCPVGGDGNRRVALDTGSETRFDTTFFSNLQNGRGVLESDQMLWTDASTRGIVQRFLGIRGLLGLTFSAEFARSMVKMSNIGVKTGTVGEIRRVCTAIN